MSPLVSSSEAVQWVPRESEPPLRGHLRDWSGAPHEIVVLAESFDERWVRFRLVGLEEAVR